MKQQRHLIPDVTAKVGETFQVKIKGNETTGYMWVLAHMPLCVCLIDVDYVPDHPIIPGSGGTRIFTFGAVAACQDYLKFNLVRPWDLLNSKESKIFALIITEELDEKSSS